MPRGSSRRAFRTVGRPTGVQDDPRVPRSTDTDQERHDERDARGDQHLPPFTPLVRDLGRPVPRRRTAREAVRDADVRPPDHRVTERDGHARVRGGRLPAVPGLDDLTTRERDVLGCLGRGPSNAASAGDPVITEAAAKTHVSRVPAELGLRSRTQAAPAAQDAGLVDRPGEVPHPAQGRACPARKRPRPCADFGMRPDPTMINSASCRTRRTTHASPSHGLLRQEVARGRDARRPPTGQAGGRREQCASYRPAAVSSARRVRTRARLRR
ncbi:response regulator transcription factor [Pseudonocardia sp. N23]|uniref:helix-turn-helix transcriptional regulator n=1 Tax=Pseudonocardia sp. N23 TaxID=1987376 RepID=UPI0035B6915C